MAQEEEVIYLSDDSANDTGNNLPLLEGLVGGTTQQAESGGNGFDILNHLDALQAATRETAPSVAATPQPEPDNTYNVEDELDSQMLDDEYQQAADPVVITISDEEFEEFMNKDTNEYSRQDSYQPPAETYISDDEIMELDPEEAAKTGLFEKSNTTFHPVVVEDNPPPFMYPPVSQPVYNDPVPVFQAGEEDPEEYLETLDREGSVLRQKYDMLQAACHRIAQSIPFHSQKLQNTVKLIQNKMSRVASLSYDAADAFIRRQLENEIEEHRKEFAVDKRTLDQSTKMLNDRRIERDETFQALLLLDERRRQVTYYSRVYRGEPLTSGFQTSFPSIYAPKKQEDVDLQDLLNNIQSQEVEEEGLALTPPEMSVTLLKHQRMGLSWLVRMENSKSKGGILADDMGLGKTIQTIALMLANRSTDSECQTNLIVGPVSLLRQWAAEIESKIKPGIRMKVGIYHGSSKKSLNSFRHMKKYDVIMTSYGTLSSEFKRHYKSVLEDSKVTKDQDLVPDIDSGGTDYTSPFFASNANFYRIVLDEAQNIKNKLAIASKAVACLKGTYRFCLSGTPMQNSVDELFPLLRFLAIKPYNDQKRFMQEISGPIKSRSNNFDQMDRDNSMKKLRAVLSAILLRRTKDSKIDGKPLLELPDKHVLKDYVEMESEEKSYYQRLEGDIKAQAEKLLLVKTKNSSSSILTLLLRLRQACIHSFLVEIGLMKAAERNDSGGVAPNWRDMYSAVVKFDPSVIERIKQDVLSGALVKDEVVEVVPGNDEEGVFTCPICLNVVDTDSIVLFGGCGHMICADCIENFFEDNETGDLADGKRIASCVTCKKPVKETQLVGYEIFHLVHVEGRDVDQISNHFDIKYPKGKTSMAQKIQLLVQEHDGFVPSAKFEKTVALMKDIFEKHPDEKILVFSQFTATFDLLRILLKHERIPFLRYDGSMSIDAKNATVKDFYQGSTKVMLLSLRAGNVGLTLTCASHVIILDPFWNPFVEEQAMDRAYRIGQQREVYVHRILIEGTVESRIMDLQDQKKDVIGAALDEKGMQGVSKLGRKELGFLFGLNNLNDAT